MLARYEFRFGFGAGPSLRTVNLDATVTRGY